MKLMNVSHLPNATVYRLDYSPRVPANHPDELLKFFPYRCLYIKVPCDRNPLVKLMMPVKRTFWQKIKFEWYLICNFPKLSFLGRESEPWY